MQKSTQSREYTSGSNKTRSTRINRSGVKISPSACNAVMQGIRLKH